MGRKDNCRGPDSETKAVLNVEERYPGVGQLLQISRANPEFKGVTVVTITQNGKSLCGDFVVRGVFDPKRGGSVFAVHRYLWATTFFICD
jgi:hypothetical protein